MKKILSLFLAVVMFSMYTVGVSAAIIDTGLDAEIESFVYRDVLIEAECSDSPSNGRKIAVATRGTVQMSSQMANIEYEITSHGLPFGGYTVRSIITDVNDIRYVFSLEGYTEGYERTEYDPVYCIREW